jgi:hypothetical protein
MNKNPLIRPDETLDTALAEVELMLHGCGKNGTGWTDVVRDLFAELKGECLWLEKRPTWEEVREGLRMANIRGQRIPGRAEADADDILREMQKNRETPK